MFVPTDYEQRVNDAVFPGLQGGPHNNNIAGIAVGLHEALQPEFPQYIHRVVDNSKHLAAKLQELGYTVSCFKYGWVLVFLQTLNYRVPDNDWWDRYSPLSHGLSTAENGWSSSLLSA